MSYRHLFVGIDTGVNTGIAIWDPENQEFLDIQTVKIHQAMAMIKILLEDSKIIVRVEDARQRKWFGKSGREKLQGAGSVKRDCKIWEDYLRDLHVKFEMVSPSRNITKLSDEQFKKITKYRGRTSEHARDAAMLVFGITKKF